MMNKEAIYSVLRLGYQGRDELIMQGTASEVKAFIASQAHDLNYGMFRYWQIDLFAYFDCGPVTYKVNASLSELGYEI